MPMKSQPLITNSRPSEIRNVLVQPMSHLSSFHFIYIFLFLRTENCILYSNFEKINRLFVIRLLVILRLCYGVAWDTWMNFFSCGSSTMVEHPNHDRVVCNFNSSTKIVKALISENHGHRFYTCHGRKVAHGFESCKFFC